MTKYTAKSKKKKSSPKKQKRILMFLPALLVPIAIFASVAVFSNLSDTNKNSTTTEQRDDSGQQTGTVAPVSLYVDPSSSAANALSKTTDPEQIRKLTVLATTPAGIWQTANSKLDIFTAKITDAKATSKTPIVVLYAIPNIGCGTSGSTSVAEYRNWVAQRAAILQGTGAIVVIEPDAVAQFSCLNAQQLTVRKESLNAAIEELAKTDAKIYVDAGHSEWVGADVISDRLNTLQMERTKGIAVNVSNFQTNEDSRQYASEVLSGLSVKNLRAVVDTSRNGVGPPSDNQWCNALGRRVGATSSWSQDGIVDGYLWIKVPGESDGTGPSCSNGIKEGSFWLEYALGLVD